MDNIKKEKHRFNIVDAIIITVLIVAVAAVGCIFFLNKERKDKEVDIYYAVECNGLRKELSGKFNAEDRLLDPANNHKMGEVVDCFTGDQEFVGINSDGIAVPTTNPSQCSIVVVAHAKAEKGESEYIIDDYYEIQVGKSVCLCSENFITYGNVIALSIVNNDEERDAFVEKAKNMMYTVEAEVEDNTNE